MATCELWRLRLAEGMKSTVEEIRRRFDADVERFSNLETGQSATAEAGFFESHIHGWTGYRTSSCTEGALVTARKQMKAS